MTANRALEGDCWAHNKTFVNCPTWLPPRFGPGRCSPLSELKVSFQHTSCGVRVASAVIVSSTVIPMRDHPHASDRRERCFSALASQSHIQTTPKNLLMRPS